VEQAGEDGAVGVGEGGLANLALQDQQLVTQGQDFDVLLSVSTFVDFMIDGRGFADSA
jgi:hypothetical protein